MTSNIIITSSILDQYVSCENGIAILVQLYDIRYCKERVLLLMREQGGDPTQLGGALAPCADITRRSYIDDIE